jgi:hypothetical protein
MLIDKALDYKGRKLLLDKLDEGDFSDMKKTTQLLFEAGYCVSDEDDHWCRLGHTTVLDNYILTDRIKECLE